MCTYVRVCTAYVYSLTFCVVGSTDNLSKKIDRNSCIKSTKSYWLRDAQTGLTFNDCTLCPHCIYVFCIYLRIK